MATKNILPDLSDLSIEELQGLLDTVSQALEAKKDARRQELLAELEKLGGVPSAPRSVRISADTGRERAKPAVKYRDDKGNTWTGRGATPKWLAAYEAEGRNRSDFAV